MKEKKSNKLSKVIQLVIKIVLAQWDLMDWDPGSIWFSMVE